MMRVKKLISFLCAAALTVSSFAGLTVTASAAAEHSVKVAVDAGTTAAKVTTTEASPVSGVLIQAKYTAGKALASVSVSDPFTTEANITLASAYETTDKIFAWDSLTGMHPYDVEVVPATVAKTAIGDVAQVAISSNGEYPATLTAAVTAKNGADFTDTSSFTYAWTKDGSPVSGVTGETLTNAEAGNYTVTATYSGTGDYEGNITSTPAFAVVDPGDTRTDINGTVTVSITASQTKVPATLTAVIADGGTNLDAETDFTYSWTKDGNAVPAQTGYQLSVTEPGEYKVTATVKSENLTYRGNTAESAGITIAKPDMTGTVTLASAQVGVETAAEVTGTPAGATLSYQWKKADASDAAESAWTNIGSATAALTQYTPVDGDAGKYIKLVVTSADYEGAAESTPVQVQAAAPKYELTIPDGVTAKVNNVALTTDTLKTIEPDTVVDLTIEKENKALKTLKVGDVTYEEAEEAAEGKYVADNYTYTASVTMNEDKTVAVEWLDIINYIGTYKTPETFDSYDNAGWTVTEGSTKATLGATDKGFGGTDVTYVGPLPEVESEYTTDALPTYVNGKSLAVQSRGSEGNNAVYTLDKQVTNGKVYISSDMAEYVSKNDKGACSYDGGTLILRSTDGTDLLTITIPNGSNNLQIKGSGRTSSTSQKVHTRIDNVERVGFNIDLVVDLDTNKATCVFDYISNDSNGKTRYQDTITVDIADKDIADLKLHVGGRSSTTEQTIMDNTQFYAITEQQDASYTVKYMLGDQELKSEQINSVAGATIPVSHDDVTIEGEKYTYVSDDSTGKKVAADNSTVVTVTVVGQVAYTVNAVVAGSETSLAAAASGTASPNTTVNAALPIAVKSGDNYYVLDDSTVTNYVKSVAVETAPATVTATYKADANIVYYSEAEDLPTNATGADQANASKGKKGHVNADKRTLIIESLAAGEYELETYVFNDPTRGVVLTSADSGDSEKKIAGDETNTTGKKTLKFTLTEATDIYITGKFTTNKNGRAVTNQSADFDYIIIRKVVEQPARTDVTAATAKITKDGTTLTASVESVTPSEAADAFTVFAWSRSAEENGTYAPIANEFGKTITADKGYFYKVTASIPASNETYNEFTTAQSAAVEVPADPVVVAKKLTYTANADDFTVNKDNDYELQANDAIIITAADDKVITAVDASVTFAKQDDGTYKYTVPETDIVDVTINGVTVEAAKHTVTITGGANITAVTLTPVTDATGATPVQDGQAVNATKDNDTYTADVASGYYLVTATYDDYYGAADSDKVVVYVNKADASETAKAAAKTKYALTGDPTDAVSFKIGDAAAGETVAWGETVTVEVEVPADKVLTALTLNDETDILAAKSFEMPKAAATVKATFADKTYTIKGTVSDKDAIAQVTLKLNGAQDIFATVEVAEDKTVTFENVPAGTYTATPVFTEADYAVTPATQEITVSADNDAAFTFTATPKLKGTPYIENAENSRTLKANEVLHVNTADITDKSNGTPTLSYKWYFKADGAEDYTEAGTETTYTPTAKGSVKVEVTAENYDGTLERTAAVASADAVMITLTIPKDESITALKVDGHEPTDAGENYTYEVESGHEATITATPATNYKEPVVVKIGDAVQANGKVTVSANTTVNVTATAQATYTLAAAVTGTASNDALAAKIAFKLGDTDNAAGSPREGKEIKVDFSDEAFADYNIGTVTYKVGEAEAQTITANEGVYKFTTPSGADAADATITVTAALTEKTYTINVTAPTGDDASAVIKAYASTADDAAEVTGGAKGTAFVVKVTPAAERVVETITVGATTYYAPGTEDRTKFFTVADDGVATVDDSLTIGTANVAVSATFADKTYNVAVPAAKADGEHGAVTVAIDGDAEEPQEAATTAKAVSGKTVVYTITPDENYIVSAYTFGGVTYSTATTTETETEKTLAKSFNPVTITVDSVSADVAAPTGVTYAKIQASLTNSGTETLYTSFADAVTDLLKEESDGLTLKLYDNIEYDNRILLRVDDNAEKPIKNLTIDGNNKTLTFTNSGTDMQQITVENGGGTLTVKDLTLAASADGKQSKIEMNGASKIDADNLTVGELVTKSSSQSKGTVKNSTIDTLKTYGKITLVKTNVTNVSLPNIKTTGGLDKPEIDADADSVFAENGKLTVTNLTLKDDEKSYPIFTGTTKPTFKAENITVPEGYEYNAANGAVQEKTFTVTATVSGDVTAIALKQGEDVTINGVLKGVQGETTQIATFSNVPAGTYTIDVTAGEKVVTITAKDETDLSESKLITISANAEGAFTVTTADAEYALSGIIAGPENDDAFTTAKGDKAVSFKDGTGNDANTITTAKKGATVYVVAPEIEGYEVFSVVAAPLTSGGTIDVTDNDDVDSFTMPEEAVQVTVTYVAATPDTFTITVDALTNDDNHGTITVTPAEGNALTAGENRVAPNTVLTIAVTPARADAYEVTAIKVGETTYEKADEAADGKFTVDESGVATATYTVADSVTITATIAEKTIPYKNGTITYDNDGDTTKFTSTGRSTAAIADMAESELANKTKAEYLENNIEDTSKRGTGGVAYNGIATDDYPLHGENIEVSFDFKIGTNNTFISLRANAATSSNRNTTATGRIFTVGGSGSTDKQLKIWGGTSTDAAPSATATGSDMSANWYHLEAVVNASTQKSNIKVYTYKANNNYIVETPILTVDDLAFRDSDAKGIASIDVYHANNGANMHVDNLYINDASYKAPNTVTATAPSGDDADATLTVANTNLKSNAASSVKAAEGETVTVAVTPVAGRKLESVTVTGASANVTPSAIENNSCTFTMPNEDVTVAAVFARADIGYVEVSGAAMVQADSSENTYTAKAYTDSTKATELTYEGNITWAIDSAVDGVSITTGGVVTVANTVDDNTQFTVKATIEGVEGTKTVTASKAQTYAITLPTVADVTGLDAVEADYSAAAAGTSVKVTPTAADTHYITGVTYTDADGNTQNATGNENGTYSFDMPAAATTVTVVLEAYKTVTVSNIPGYATIYASTSELTGSEAPVAWTDHLGKILYTSTGTATKPLNFGANSDTAAPTVLDDVTKVDPTYELMTGLKKNETVYYKIVKSGYDNLTGNTGAITEDAEINGAMTPNSATKTTFGNNVVWYEDVDWNLNNSKYNGDDAPVFGYDNKAWRTRQNAIGTISISSRTAVLNTDILSLSDGYEFIASNFNAPYGKSVTANYYLRNGNDNIVKFKFVGTDDKAVTPYITIGKGEETALAASTFGTLSVKVAPIGDGKGLVTVTFGTSASNSVSGVIEKYAVINQMYNDGDVNNLRFNMKSLAISKLTPQTVNFTVAKGTTTLEDLSGIPIVIKDKATGTTVATATTAAGGTASASLVPGTYTYSIAATESYQAEEADITVANETLNVSKIALAGNDRKKVAVNLVYTTEDYDGTNTPTALKNADGENLIEHWYTTSDSPYLQSDDETTVTISTDDIPAEKRDYFKIASSDGTTFKRYKVKEIKNLTTPHKNTDSTELNIYLVSETDSRDYYFFEGFDGITKDQTINSGNPDPASLTEVSNFRSNYRNYLQTGAYKSYTIGSYTFDRAVSYAGTANQENGGNGRTGVYTMSATGIGGKNSKQKETDPDTYTNVGVSFKISVVGAWNTYKFNQIPIISIQDSTGTLTNGGNSGYTDGAKLFTITDDGGWFAALKINDTTPTDYSTSKSGTSAFPKDNICTLVWDVDAQVDFSTGKVHLTVKEIDTGKTLYDQTYATTVANISRLVMGTKGHAGCMFDDIGIYKFNGSIE